MGGQIRRGRIWRFWGAPNFQSRGPKYLFLKGLGTSREGGNRDLVMGF